MREWHNGKLTESELEELRALIPEPRISTSPSQLEAHSHDESFHPPHCPDLVIWPITTAEASAVLKLAHTRGIPVTPYAAGTSLEGNPIPVCGGIALDMRQMDQILSMRPQDLRATVQPGLDFKKLNERVRKHGLFFPPDPGATATLGGMVANNAKGIRAVKYGGTGDHVLELEVVLANGEVIRTGGSPYDLTSLFVGSEGTLGVFSEVTVRLALWPQHFVAAVACFSTMEQAAQTVTRVVQSGLQPLALELLNRDVIALINRCRALGMREEETLFMEFSGASREALSQDLQLVEEICTRARCTGFVTGYGPEARDELWQARYAVHDSIRASYPQTGAVVVDVAVPISKYPEVTALAEEIARSNSLRGFPFGHAAEGNLHVEILYQRDSTEEKERAERANQQIVSASIGLGGTATGEHGVGIGKRRFMPQEHGLALQLMRTLKAQLDPRGILNPGKVFPG